MDPSNGSTERLGSIKWNHQCQIITLELAYYYCDCNISYVSHKFQSVKHSWVYMLLPWWQPLLSHQCTGLITEFILVCITTRCGSFYQAQTNSNIFKLEPKWQQTQSSLAATLVSHQVSSLGQRVPWSPGQGCESSSSMTSPVEGGRVGLGQTEGESIGFNDREGKHWPLAWVTTQVGMKIRGETKLISDWGTNGQVGTV